MKKAPLPTALKGRSVRKLGETSALAQNDAAGAENGRVTKLTSPHRALTIADLPVQEKEKLASVVHRCVVLEAELKKVLAALAEEQSARRALEGQLENRSAEQDLDYYQSIVRSKEQELHEMEEKQSVLSGLLALYQAKLKNVSEIMRFYELAEKEGEIKTTQLQRDVASLESLVASQKLTIESIERTSARSYASLQEAQQGRQQAQDALALAQLRLAQAEARMSGQETAARSQEELLHVKERAIADLEGQNARLRAEVAALNAVVAQATAAAQASQHLPVPAPTAAAAPAAAPFYGKSIAAAAPVSREVISSQPLRRGSYDELFADESQSQSRILPGSAANSIASHSNAAAAPQASIPERLLVPLPERSIVFDDSYGAMYGSVDSTTAHNISFGSSITAQTFAASESRYDDPEDAGGVAEGQDSNVGNGSFLLDTRGVGSAPVTALSRVAEAESAAPRSVMTNSAGASVEDVRRGISLAAASEQSTALAPPQHTALDPTPMKRRVPRRLSEAISAVSGSALDDPLLSVVTGSSNQPSTVRVSATADAEPDLVAARKPRVTKRTADPAGIPPQAPASIPATPSLRHQAQASVPDSEPRALKVKKDRPAQQAAAVEATTPAASKKKRAAGQSDPAPRSTSCSKRGVVTPAAPRHRPLTAPELESGRHHTFSAAAEGSTSRLHPARTATASAERQSSGTTGIRGAAPKTLSKKPAVANSRKSVSGSGGADSAGRSLDTSVVYDDSLFGLIDDIELS